VSLHRVRKGLDLPIAGEPEQVVDTAAQPERIALLGQDYLGMRPTMKVAVGQRVKRGEVLFEDKKMPGVVHTSPAAGTVTAIHRGARRAFLSIVVELNQAERQGRTTEEDEVSFEAYSQKEIADLSGEEVKALLIESGLWTALRARPFSRVADPAAVPHSIFVTAMDTHPLAPSVETVLRGREADFEKGVLCVSKLTEGKTFVCKAPDAAVPVPPGANIQVEEFAGPHPAGTVGLHIHFLDPVHRDKTVWHLGFQDATAIGKLFTTGRLDSERVVSLAGPSVKKPRLLRTRLGAALDELLQGELKEGEHRVISGSVLSGRAASGDILGYLGRYHQQISVLAEGRRREFLGWMTPGVNRFSTVRAFASALMPKKKFAFTTTTHGSERAMVPIGMYERVMPMDILPTFLLRALLVGDLERAEQLGCLELDEEDLALCTFVCPGKLDYGPVLRDVLTEIEKEG